MAFYTALGFTNNPQFTDDTAAAMVFSEEIYVMLLTYDKFKGFIKKPIADTNAAVGAINCLGLGSPEAVHKIADAAIAAGGKETNDPQDYGFMIGRSFQDLDGHHWEAIYMDLSKFPG